jgi:hypothetical protein
LSSRRANIFSKILLELGRRWSDKQGRVSHQPIFVKSNQIYPALFVLRYKSLNRVSDQWGQLEVVADMPLLEVESSPADPACCKTCSKDPVAHGKGGVVLFMIYDLQLMI